MPANAFSKYDRARNAELVSQACACFNDHVTSEHDALEIIFRLLNNNKSCTCPFCGGDKIIKEVGSRTVYCLECKRNSWFTSRTFFDGIRKPKAYLLAIWLMECGLSFSANSFAKHAKISYDTAWIILKKLDMVIDEKFTIDSFSILSAHFREVFLKRSCETPAKQKPAFEQDELEEQEQESEKSLDGSTKSSHGQENQVDSFDSLGDLEKEIFNLLLKEKLDVDTIAEKTQMTVSQVMAALTMLELEEFIEEEFGGRFKVVPKPRKTKPSKELDSTAKAIVYDVIYFLKASLHGISRRYLQFYLARLWCLKDRINWGHGKLLEACISSNRIRKSDILKYVSPLSVRLHTPGTELTTSFAL